MSTITTTEQTKNNSSKTLLIIGILALLGFAFYWFSIRPANIRKDCDWYALVVSVEAYPIDKVTDMTQRAELQKNYYDTAYEGCLAGKGLQ